MWGKRFKAAWAAYRQVAAVKGLLEWTGAYKWFVGALLVLIGVVTAHLAALPIHLKILAGLTVSILLLFFAGVATCLVRVVRTESPANSDEVAGLINVPKWTDASPLPSFLPVVAPSTGYRPVDAVIRQPLSQEECFARWSDKGPEDALCITVDNITPRSSYCTIKICGIHRWSHLQRTFIDARFQRLYGSPFEIYKHMTAPEHENPYRKCITPDGASFTILGYERDRIFRGSESCRWRLSLTIDLGGRTRSQELCFEWDGRDLSPSYCGPENPLLENIAPQPQHDYLSGTDFDT